MSYEKETVLGKQKKKVLIKKSSLHTQGSIQSSPILNTKGSWVFTANT